MSLKGITCTESDKHYDEESTKFACAHAVSKALEQFLGIEEVKPFREEDILISPSKYLEIGGIEDGAKKD